MFNHCYNNWLWPDQLINILCLIFLNINNIQHQQLKLFIQKRLNLKTFFFFFSFWKLKRVNCPMKLNLERTVQVMLCEQSRSKFCANRPSRIVPGGTGFCANRPGAISRSVVKSRRHCRRFPEIIYLRKLKNSIPSSSLRPRAWSTNILPDVASTICSKQLWY